MSNPPPIEDDADPTYSHFAHRAEFEAQLARFLAIDVCGEPSAADDDAEVRLVNSLGAILDYYLPMPGLLDPALDNIVPPLMGALSSALASGTANPARLARVGRLVNWVVKVRGWKAVGAYAAGLNGRADPQCRTFPRRSRTSAC
ncbi:hypothetical protein Q8F55_000974 [Vanrija albida]|uniref:Uncharacterized protein n=1 Tax=Vanrija albida TaxID=181172 RepID=A0ABR3QFU5_9TREE